MEDILKRALSLAEEAEIYAENFENTTVSFQANRLKSIDSSFGQGIGLRIIKNGKIGFSSITNVEDTDLLVASAVKSADFGQPAFFKLPTPSNVPQVTCFDEQIPAISVEQMADEGEKAIERIAKEFPEFQCEAEIDKTIVNTSIVNSAGLTFAYKKTFYDFSMYAFLAKEGDFLGISEVQSSCQHKNWSELIAQKTIEKIPLAKQRTTINTGAYPVIFTAKAMPVILNLLKKGINGKFVQKKISPLFSKLNTLVTSPLLHIVDDATFPYAKASSPVDGEGVSTHPSSIIEEGILKSFVYDLQTAGLMNTQTTANASRDYSSLPSPANTNFIVKPGKLSLNEMVKDIKEGLIVDQVIGSGQSNVLMGEFSVNIDLGFKIEQGKIKGRIKNAMVTGNIYELLKNIIGVGNELEIIGSTYTPPFYFASINIAS